jgi:hypothetical protein
VNLIHVLSPDVPQEGAQGPFAGTAGGAQLLFKGVAIVREGVQGSEGQEGVHTGTTRAVAGQSIARGESELVRSNSLYIK